MKTGSKTGFVFIFFILLSVAAKTQITKDTIRVDEVRVTAKLKNNAAHAGVKVTHFDSIVMASKLAGVLSSLISENTSVYIKSYGRGALATAAFRGTAPSHTKVSWNGLDISSPLLGMTDLSQIPLFITDKVNLTFGAATLTQSSGALGGHVELKSGADWSEKNDFGYFQSLSSFHGFDESFFFQVGSSRVKFKSRFYHSFSKNNYSYLNKTIFEWDTLTNEKIFPVEQMKNADFLKYGSLQEFYIRSKKNNFFSLKWWFQNDNRGIPRVSSYEGNENANINRDENRMHSIVAEWSVRKEKNEFKLVNGFVNKEMDYFQKNYILGSGYQYAVFSLSKQRSFQNEFSWIYVFNNKISIKSNFVANYQSVFTYDKVKKNGYNVHRPEFSLQMQAIYKAGEKFALNGVLGKKMLQEIALPVYYMYGLDFFPSENKNLVLKLAGSFNIHEPSLNDLFWQPGGNPNLLPEESRNLEGGLYWLWNIKKHSFETEFTFFFNKIINWISWLPSDFGYWQALNVAHVKSKGLELSMKWNYVNENISFYTLANYGLNKVLNFGDENLWGEAAQGLQMPFIPVHSGNIFVLLKVKNMYTSWQHNSYSERFITNSVNTKNRKWLYPYFMNDLLVGYLLKLKKAELNMECKISNLFNEVYRSELFIPMPGRNYMFTLKYRPDFKK